MWHFLQGGKDYQQIDRDAAEAMMSADWDIGYMARQCREFLTRAVTFLAAEAGIRQFLDLGCGLPAPAVYPNVHELVQAAHPDGRVVYVDSDKVVLAHARVLLRPTTSAGVCAYIDSDVRDIDSILEQAAETLDFSEPVGVVMFGVLGAIAFDDAQRVARRVVDAIPSGSYVAFEDGADLDKAEAREGMRRRLESGVDHYQLRSPDELRSYFEGMEMIEPGLVSVVEWRPNPLAVQAIRPVDPFGCVVRKP